MINNLRTRQIEEIRVLVELVEYGARSVLDLRGSYYGNGILRELCGEL